MENISKEYTITAKEFWAEYLTDEANHKTIVQRNIVQSPIWKTIVDKQLPEDVRQMLIGLTLNTYFEDLLKLQRLRERNQPQPPRNIFDASAVATQQFML